MPIISVRDNENSRWKRNAKNNKKKQTKTKKSKGTEAIVKGSELNNFVVHSNCYCHCWVEFRVSFINHFKTKRVIWAKAYCVGV